MKENTQGLKNEIVEKNKLIDYFNQKYDLDKSKVQNIEVELDSLLYKYYKTLKNGDQDLLTKGKHIKKLKTGKWVANDIPLPVSTQLSICLQYRNIACQRLTPVKV